MRVTPPPTNTCDGLKKLTTDASICPIRVPAPCTIAYFHHPTFTVGPQGNTTRMNQIWQLFNTYNVDIVLNGHYHDYQRFVKPSELAAWCRASSLRGEELIGMTYNPFSRRYRLGPDCDVNYLLACARDA